MWIDEIKTKTNIWGTEENIKVDVRNKVLKGLTIEVK